MLLTKNKTNCYLTLPAGGLTDQQVIPEPLVVPLVTSRQACASLSKWSSRASHLYNAHKATVKFKNSLTDEPGTPWAPTVSQLSPFFVVAWNRLPFHLLVGEHKGKHFLLYQNGAVGIVSVTLNRVNSCSFCSHSSVRAVLYDQSIIRSINQSMYIAKSHQKAI